MLASALAVLFPDATPGVDYEVRDDSDGAGPKIVRWNLAAPRPTAAELATAAAQAEASYAAKRDIAALEEATGLNRKAREWLLSQGSFANMKAALSDVDTTIATKRASIRGR
jgi:hypothetical protein